MSVYCATCILACGTQVYSIEMVNDYEEYQTGLCRYTRSGEGQTRGLD